jgi:type II secretory pathway pseudopilin PulG
MRRCSGFTLIEICLAVLIGLLLVTLMVPSVAGLFAEQKLKSSFEEFDKFVRTAQMRSVSERRDYVMVFEEDGITLEPADPTEEDAANETERFIVPENADITLERPVALQKNPPMEWPFWRSGTCEPVVVSYAGDAGTWVMKYDPLTVRATTLEQLVK